MVTDGGDRDCEAPSIAIFHFCTTNNKKQATLMNFLLPSLAKLHEILLRTPMISIHHQLDYSDQKLLVLQSRGGLTALSSVAQIIFVLAEERFRANTNIKIDTKEMVLKLMKDI